MVSKSESCQIYVEISTPVNLEVLSTSLKLIFQDFIPILGKLVPNLKLYQIYLKICTQGIWKVFNGDLTWTSYNVLFKT